MLNHKQIKTMKKDLVTVNYSLEKDGEIFTLTFPNVVEVLQNALVFLHVLEVVYYSISYIKKNDEEETK